MMRRIIFSRSTEAVRPQSAAAAKAQPMELGVHPGRVTGSAVSEGCACARKGTSSGTEIRCYSDVLVSSPKVN